MDSIDMDFVNTYNVRDYIHLTRGTKKFQENFDNLLEDLPTTFQLKLVEGIFMKIILANNVINLFMSQSFKKKEEVKKKNKWGVLSK